MVIFALMPTLLRDAKTFLILSAISIILILADSFNLLNLPKSAIQFITIPVQYGLYKSSLAIGKQFEFIILARRASQENQALQEQLATVISDNANLRRQLAEAQGFLTQQQSLSPDTYSLVAARPISTERYLRIDKGSDDGIKTSMPVVYKDSYLGQVKDVSSRESDVILSSDPDSKVAAFVSDSGGKAQGVLLGQFGSDMLLDQVLHQEPLSVGDLVYSSGTEGTLPRGLVLGQVTSVLNQPNQVFKQALVKPIFQASDLDIVFVMTN